MINSTLEITKTTINLDAIMVEEPNERYKSQNWIEIEIKLIKYYLKTFKKW